MTTWCVYALYKLITSGNPYESPNIFGIPKHDKNNNLYQDIRQTDPSTRIVRFAENDNIYIQRPDQTKLPMKSTNNSSYSVDYSSTIDYDTTPAPSAEISLNKTSNEVKILPSDAAIKTYSTKKPARIIPEIERRVPLPSTNKVVHVEAETENLSKPSLESKQNNETETSQVVDKVNKEQVKEKLKINNKFNIIPIASFTTKDESDDADYTINVDDMTYDDVNAADERNPIPGIETNSTSSEPEETNEDENENEDNEEANEKGSGEEDNSEESNGNNDINNTPEMFKTGNKEDSTENSDQDNVNKTKPYDGSTRGLDIYSDNMNDRTSDQQDNSKVIFDDSPPSSGNSADEDNEDESGGPTSNNTSLENKHLRSVAYQPVTFDLPMDENNPDKVVGIEIQDPDRSSSSKEVSTDPFSNSLINNENFFSKRKISTESKKMAGVNRKRRIDESSMDVIQPKTVSDKIITSVGRHKRETASTTNVVSKLMPPYEMESIRIKEEDDKSNQSLLKRSSELENLRPESSDTHVSGQLHLDETPTLFQGKNLANTTEVTNYTSENDTTVSPDNLSRSDQSQQESSEVENINTKLPIDGITHLPMYNDNVPIINQRYDSGITEGKQDAMLNVSIPDILNDIDKPALEGNMTFGNPEPVTAADLHRENQLISNLFNVDHGLLIYPSEHPEEKKKSHHKKKHSNYKKQHKHKMSKGYKKGGEKKKKHKKEEKKFLKEKGFKGAKKGKKVVKGKGGQGGKKGMKKYKDKGYKKKGFKNVYHKEEFGDSKKYFDEFRDKDFKKKYKKFKDNYEYKQMKKWQGKDVKKAKKFKDHGESYKKTGKSKWKKKLSKSSKKGEKHKSHGEKKKKSSYGY